MNLKSDDDIRAIDSDVISEYIDLVCNYPRMYTLNGTIFEASCWLNGFVAGLENVNPSLTVVWHDFIEWLPSRLGYPQNRSWEIYILQLYPDEREAFNHFLMHYREYVNYIKSKM